MTIHIPWLGPDDEFPDPRTGILEQGLVAAGGDLQMERLLSAYERGIFPWYAEGDPLLWWSPEHRCIFEPGSLHVPRRLRRTLRRVLPDGDRGGLRLTWNRAFVSVMRGCGERDEGTWIFPEMLAAYTALHEAGHAHSLEVWDGDALVGGLYGVQRGGLFAAESMFYRVRDASKIAVVAAVRSLWAAGTRLFDVQFQTSHLASLGSFEISRDEYLRRLSRCVSLHVDLRSLALDWRADETWPGGAAPD